MAARQSSTNLTRTTFFRSRDSVNAASATPMSESTSESTSLFLALPLELREIVYKLFLSEIQHNLSWKQQPSNEHFKLLHVCRQISSEAEELAGFRSYVTLSHEAQITAFNHNISDDQALKITAIDVGNDARLVHAPGHPVAVPASQLYVVLNRLVSLRKLRVFECNRSRPISNFTLGSWFTLNFEKALFPFSRAPDLDCYELCLSPFKSSARIFQVLSSQTCTALRLSGNCEIQRGTVLPKLLNLTISGVTGHHLDHRIEQHFGQSYLKTFQYRLGDRSGARFELRDRHLESLAFGQASRLEKLSLLGCNRLSTSTLTSCLNNLKSLRHLALSFVYDHDLDNNFVVAFPLSLSVLKLAVTNAWYAVPRLNDELLLRESAEELVILRNPSLNVVCIQFRDEIMGERGLYWRQVSAEHKFNLNLGPWDEDF